MKHTLKSIVTMVLAAAILVTGIGMDAVTVNAANDPYAAYNFENLMDMNGSSITIKEGDRKCFEFYKLDGDFKYNRAEHFEWTSSDEDIVEVFNLQWGIITFVGNVAGTAVITGTPENKESDERYSFTVTVKGPDMTAKQKKCRHSWKTTKKATCIRTGIKTCKKCRLQKATVMKAHTWKTYEKQVETYDTYIAFYCDACVCEDPQTHENHRRNGKIYCDNRCWAEFGTNKYGSCDAAYEALVKHTVECDHRAWDLHTCAELPDPDRPITKTVTVTKCTQCDFNKEDLSTKQKTDADTLSEKYYENHANQ